MTGTSGNTRPEAGRGFSLIEAAIVLGIVGLVIGGIWVAASAVHRQWRIDTVLEAITMARAAAQKSHKRVEEYTEVGLDSIMYGQTLPGGFIYDASNYAFMRGNERLGLTISRDLVGDPNPYFIFGYLFNNANTTPQKDVCIALSNKFLTLNLGRDPLNLASSINWWDNNTSSYVGQWSTGATKPTMAQISTYCETTTLITVYEAL